MSTAPDSSSLHSFSLTAFLSKQQARQWVWDALQNRELACAPLPPHGRIPNFIGAEAAAQRIFEHLPWATAKAIKVNPDSAQLAVRLAALRRGIRVFVPTPKLAAGFNLLDPNLIPAANYVEAATLATMNKWARAVALEHLPQLDAIVTGCAAVTLKGKRCGKGAGYSDIEFGILRELGHRVVPVATTAHDVQVVGDFPIESNDLPLSLICTPTCSVRVSDPLPAPAGLMWDRLSDEALDAMPVLRDLARLQSDKR
jgi:5-formyltetrahydrofolate cyclo-ligase